MESHPRSSHAPRWATALLRALLPAADRAVVLDELSELWEIRCARDGARAARRWYVRQALAFAWALARWGRRRGVREHRSRFRYEMLRRNQGGVDMTRWTRELAQGARRLRRAPVFTLVATATIAIGIGAFTSIFSLVESVLLEPMPYEDPEELTWVWRDYVGANFPRGWLGGPDIAAFAQHPEVFEDVVAFRTGSFNLAGIGGEAPAQVVANQASTGFFEMLGVPLLLGRAWRPEEDVPGGPNVAVLSHELWRTHFGSDAGIVGSTITLDGQAAEVIGVAPERFRFVKHGSLVDPVEADLYMPLYTDLAAEDPGAGAYAALVRLASDVHPDQVGAALAAAAEPYNAAFGGDGGSTIRLWTVGLAEDLVEPVRPALAALIAAAAFLLLVLAANLATLLLGRAAMREHELGVRLALGAGREGVLASVIAETALVAGGGGVLGVALAFLGTDLVVGLAPDDLPRLASVGVDASVLAVALAVTTAMAIAAGTTPALHALRANVAATLKEGGARSGGSVGRARARSVLVGTQVALSLMLLVGAGLIAQAFAGLLRQDPGFDASSALTFRVPLPPGLYPDAATRLAFHDDLRVRLAALPGVESVGAANALPLTLATNQSGIAFPGAPGNTGDRLVDDPLVDWFRVTPGYFTAAGFRLLAGRDFEPLDADTTTFNIVIDDVLASRFFPGGSAVGARAVFFGDTATIVGVVDQARLYNVHADDRGQAYLAFQRFPTTSMSYVVRSAVDPTGLAPSARAVLAELDASLPMANVRTLEEIVDASLGQQRLSLTLVVAFALGALLLATLGIYGVVSNAVVRRTREIGLRMALGADPSSVVGHVLRQGIVLSVAGALVGLVGAIATSRTLSSVVAGVDPSDPLVYAAVAVGLVAVAGIASYLPARRATRIDPLAALTPE